MPSQFEMASADPFASSWRSEEIGIVASTTESSSLYLFDRLLGLAAFAATIPIIGIAAIGITVLSRRNPFLRHRRAGRFGAPLNVIKLRTMWGVYDERELDDYASPKTPNDPRVTSRFARFCRRYSIDELPQLLQVARGEMSLVGPRALTERELGMHYRSVRREVLRLRPGLSGLWQVKGRNRLTYSQRRRLDVFLARHYSAGLYFRILIATGGAVLSGRDAW